MKILIILVSVLFIFGCGTPPKVYKVDKARTINKTYDNTWAKIVRWFSENNSPIKNMDKSSGFISSEYNLRVDGGTTYADCGSPEFAIRHGDTKGNFSIILEKAGDSVTKVTTNIFFKVERYNINTGGFVGQSDCNSTGVLEKELLDYISR